MGPVTVSFGVASSLALLLVARDAHWRLNDQTFMALYLWGSWVLAAVLRRSMGGITDYLFPLIALLGGLLAMGLWEKRPHGWKFLLALTYLAEIGVYLAYYTSLKAKSDSYMASLRLNVTFAIQLCIISSEAITNVAEHMYSLVQRGMLHRPAVHAGSGDPHVPSSAAHPTAPQSVSEREA